MTEVIIGVVADTHVPDRIANLHPGLIPGLRAAGVSQILHAGDICTQSVIDELSTVAPVIAVQGNRDFLMNGNRHHLSHKLEVMGVKIGIFHGHGSWTLYFYEKLYMLTHGYRLGYYEKLARKTFSEADIFIFGHTHKPENAKASGKLILNPGSAGIGGWSYPPSYAIIRIHRQKPFQSEIIELTGAKRINGWWQKI